MSLKLGTLATLYSKLDDLVELLSPGMQSEEHMALALRKLSAEDPGAVLDLVLELAENLEELKDSDLAIVGSAGPRTPGAEYDQALDDVTSLLRQAGDEEAASIVGQIDLPATFPFIDEAGTRLLTRADALQQIAIVIEKTVPADKGARAASRVKRLLAFEQGPPASKAPSPTATATTQSPAPAA